MFRSFICSSLILTPVSYQRLSNTAFTRSPRRVVVALIRFTTVSKLTRGSAFQFILINEDHPFLLLGVDRNHRLALRQKALRGLVEVAKLSVALGMRSTLLVLDVSLQRVVQLP